MLTQLATFSHRLSHSHFEKFLLITQKQIDFELFKKIVVLLSQNLPSSYALQLKTAL